MEKYVKQRCSKVNPALRGWFKVDIGLDNYYCVCDGMTAILLDPENIADLPFEQSAGMNVAQCFPSAWESFEKIEIKENELKTLNKNIRNYTDVVAIPNSKGFLVDFGNMIIDTDRLLDVASALGDGTLYKNSDRLGACVYKSKLEIGLVLPINKKSEYAVKQYSEYLDMIKANL